MPSQTMLWAAALCGVWAITCSAEPASEGKAGSASAAASSTAPAPLGVEGVIYAGQGAKDIGRPLADQKVESAVLKSLRNDNQRYLLVLQRATPFIDPAESWARLLVQGETLWSHQSGGDPVRFPKETGGIHPYQIQFSVSEALRPKVVELFHPKIEERRHPGHRMLAVFKTDRPEFAPGEAVTGKVTITNVGDAPFTFQIGGYQGARDNQFSFTAKLWDKVLPDVGSPRHMGGLNGDKTLNPKESVEVPFDLSKWFKLDQPGVYSLMGTYRVDLSVPIDGSLFRETIWNDFACGEFHVRIAKKGEPAK